MIIADSSVWIAFFNGVDRAETQALRYMLGRNEIVCGDLIVAEVLQGFRSDRDYHKARSLLLALDVFALVGKDIALFAVANYRQLRKEGTTLRRTVDLLIGTWCIANDAILLHMDRDFDKMQKLGLKIWRSN